MKKTIFILFLLSFQLSIFGQKKVVAFTAFENNAGNLDQSGISAIQNKVIESFNKTNRFVIVDRTNFDKLQQEKELQKSEAFIDGKTVKQNSLEGAEQIVTGTINQVTISKYVSEKGYVSYNAKIYLTLKVIDVATGKLLATEMIKAKQGFGASILSASLGGAGTPQKAFFNALSGMQRSIDKFVAKYFPVETRIIEVSKVSKDKARTVLIDIGDNKGVKKGQYFDVYEIKKIKVGNKEIDRKLLVGKLKITEVQGDEISEAKVMKGHKEILAKFNANANLICYSKN